ncbi:GntR family transcriptional regulator [Streptomyces sp. NPDC060209]|uniref:GntR family transcriptional regulator n=1 Tax=Streptomyces sp. NPDC060209 TaxID=3347073 RepID=UPI00365DEE67
MSDDRAVQFGPSAMLSSLLHLEEPDSLVSQIVLNLALDIIEGRARPGQTLNSLDLAKRFDTSRTPVREALFALEREGLLEIQARKRPRVMSRSLDQVAEIYHLRAELHALLAKEVARRAGPEDLSQIESHLAALKDAVDRGDNNLFFWQNVAFHDFTTTVARNLTTKRVLNSLGLQVLRLRHLTMSLPDRMAASYRDHERLVLAYQEHDVQLAGALSRSLIIGALGALESLSPDDLRGGY